MAEKVASQIRLEIEQIDHLLTSYADLLAQVRQRPPNLVEVTATASVLHSFYNGLENIFLSVAKGIDADVPAGTQWHRDLLNQMTESTANRTFVLSRDAAQRLTGYLGFRHFYRHTYSFFLDWDELEKLVTPLTDVWAQTKSELLVFVSHLTR